jgi:hypothetical protein
MQGINCIKGQHERATRGVSRPCADFDGHHAHCNRGLPVRLDGRWWGWAMSSERPQRRARHDVDPHTATVLTRLCIPCGVHDVCFCSGEIHNVLTVLRLNSQSVGALYSGVEMQQMEVEEQQLIRGLKDLYEQICMQTGQTMGQRAIPSR